MLRHDQITHVHTEKTVISKKYESSSTLRLELATPGMLLLGAKENSNVDMEEGREGGLRGTWKTQESMLLVLPEHLSEPG